MRPVFALLTDFGPQSLYLGQLKAVLLSGCPDCTILDICHDLPPHAVLEAAFFLSTTLPYLPSQSIVMAVVDPGVGTERELVLLDTGTVRILAPNNGILAPLAHLGTLWRLPIPPHASSTFHGRDILAPAALRLALGTSIEDIAIPWETTPLVPLPRPPRPKGNVPAALVLHVDRFGNCLLDLPATRNLPQRLLVHGRAARVVSTYGELDFGELGLVVGSQGVWELALREDSAAKALGIKAGDWVLWEEGQ